MLRDDCIVNYQISAGDDVHSPIPQLLNFWSALTANIVFVLVVVIVYFLFNVRRYLNSRHNVSSVTLSYTYTILEHRACAKVT